MAHTLEIRFWNLNLKQTVERYRGIMSGNSIQLREAEMLKSFQMLSTLLIGLIKARIHHFVCYLVCLRARLNLIKVNFVALSYENFEAT